MHLEAKKQGGAMIGTNTVCLNNLCPKNMYLVFHWTRNFYFKVIFNELVF